MKGRRAMYAKQIKWVTGSGREAIVTVAVSEDLDRAGNRRTGTAVVQVSATVGGVDMGCTLTEIKHPVAVAKIGNLGINAENYALILTAITEANATPEVVAHKAAIAAGLAEVSKYETEHAAVKNAMNA
jgi:hypothetical protein